MDVQSEASEVAPPVTTVSKSVLDHFLEELAKIDGLKDVAANLEKTVIHDAIFAEPAIRAAIFPENI